ncbi:hypothetical protein [Veillonella sp.]|uniref:hypothetical protein n=1 Tax=Veillonella sp. TaxID=1926307 RepID=UPI00290CC078|nr:hypothetical protein [Veillonella sp.]MDU3433520.1 hypothetical protein [Veillonella sp.]
MDNLKDMFRKVTNKSYKTGWKINTIIAIFLSLLSFFIAGAITLYKEMDTTITIGSLTGSLNTGTLFIVSLSLMSNFVTEGDTIAEENEKLICHLNKVAIAIALLIAFFYGASYNMETHSFILEYYQVIISAFLYIITIGLIGSYNYLNRCDDIEKMLTENSSENLIAESIDCRTDSGGFEI